MDLIGPCLRVERRRDVTTVNQKKRANLKMAALLAGPGIGTFVDRCYVDIDVCSPAPERNFCR
jgi:hypothetical protein